MYGWTGLAQAETRRLRWFSQNTGQSFFRSPTWESLSRRGTLRCNVAIGDVDVQAGEQVVREIQNLGR